MERNKTHARVLKMVVMGLLVAVSIVLVTLCLLYTSDAADE